MKKVLMGTSALAALGLAAVPAAAQESGKIKLGIGGYYLNYVSFVSQTEEDVSPTGDFNQINVRQEGEIHFKGETTLDNGLKVGFRSEFEVVEQGIDGNNPTDEVYVYFEGGWGRLVLGADDTAPSDMQYAAPSAGLGVNSPNFYLFEPAGLAPTGGFLGQLTSDANEAKYFTPRIFGFQFGVSYVPNIDNTNGDRQSGGLVEDDNLGDYHNIVGVGLNYENTLFGVDVSLSGGWEHYDSENSAGPVFEGARDDWAFGAQFGYAGFTLGGGYFQTDNGLHGSNDSNLWDVGIQYDTGPWSVSFEWVDSETELGRRNEDKHDQFELATSYKAGPGVTFTGGFQYFYQDNDTAKDANGWGIYAGTRLDF